MQNTITADSKKYFSKNVTFTMKGIGIIFMLIHHLFSCFPDYVEKYGVSSSILSMNQVLTISVFGKICVAIFVFLSAYGMTISLEKSRGGRSDKYLIKRYLRLEYGFLFVYLLSILTSFLRADNLRIYFGEGIPKGLWYMGVDALGMAGFMGTPTYNETWWYMSVAILLVFIIPVFIKLYELFGISMVVICGMLSYLGVNDTPFSSYIFALILGIFMAETGIIQRLSSLDKKRSLWLLTVGTVVLFLFCEIRIKWGYTYWMDGSIAMLLSVLLFLVVDKLRLRIRCLELAGQYSMNIFLVHTLIFEYYFRDFIYSFRHWLLITLVLLGISFIISVCIEYIKGKVYKILANVFLKLCSPLCIIENVTKN